MCRYAEISSPVSYNIHAHVNNEASTCVTEYYIAPIDFF